VRARPTGAGIFAHHLLDGYCIKDLNSFGRDAKGRGKRGVKE